MRRLFLFFVLLAFACNAQVKVDKGAYQIVYSEEYMQPLKVTYQVLCPQPGASRKGLGFFSDGILRQSGPKDYYKNVWDKGHMAPAASFDCSYEMIKSTFSYLNCALQHERLNRGAWKYLEAYERRKALYTDVYVEIIIHFDTHIGVTPGGAVIPSGFTKKLITEDETLTFYFNNEAPLFTGSDSFWNYKITAKSLSQ